MRITVIAAAIGLSLVGLSMAADVRAAMIRKSTNIPAQELSAALRTLAKDRDFQIVYASKDVSSRRTAGAVGEFTAEEALKQLLVGTGLSYRYLDEQTVTITPANAATSSATDQQRDHARAADTLPQTNSNSDADEKGKAGRSLWDRFRLAQANPAVAAGSVPVGGAKETQPGSPVTLDEVVVTGTAAGAGVKKLEAGYAITTLSDTALEQMAPQTTSEVLTAVPGVWVESSGGTTSSNVFVRGIPSTGDAPFVTMQFDGVPVYGANSPSFMDQLGLVRLDETVAAVEAVNGGPASVFSDGQPGLTTNLILKEGHERTEGELKVSATDYGQRRLDTEMSGKLTDGLYYMIGGYAVSGDTVRSAGFDTEQGEQFTVNITRLFEDGKFNIFARYTDDHDEWFTPFAASVPGLDKGTYNQLNNYTRYATIIVPGSAGSGATERLDLGDGRGWKGVIAGGALTYELGGGLDFIDHFGFTDGVLQTIGLVPQGAGAETVAQAFLDGAGNPGQTTVQTVHTGQTLAPTDYVQQYAAWLVRKQLRAVTNDAAITATIAHNQVTAGFYFNHFSSDDVWSLGNTRWMQVGGSGDLVNLNNGALGAFAIADSGSADINAFYLADSWSVTDRLRIDAAAREESQQLKFLINGAGAPAIPGESPNPHVDQSRFSWTVGANYKLVADLDFYVRASDGHHFPTFDDVRSQLGQTATQDVLDKPWDVKSEEGGIKFHNRSFDADVTGFYDEVRGAVYNDVGVPPVLAGSNAYGVEIDGRWTSDFGFSLTSDDVWEHSRSCCSAGDPLVNGKQAERIPSYQIRVTPAFRINMGPATVDLFATYAAISKRYGDLQNQQPLPAYQTVFAGFMVDIGRLTLQLTGDNLFNSHGLTEGNPRSLGTAVPLYLPDVRPIFGRSVTGSVTVHF